MIPTWTNGEKDRRNELKMRTGETVYTQQKRTTTYIYFL